MISSEEQEQPEMLMYINQEKGVCLFLPHVTWIELLNLSEQLCYIEADWYRLLLWRIGHNGNVYLPTVISSHMPVITSDTIMSQSESIRSASCSA